MNRCNNHEKAIAMVATWWLSDLVAPAKAFHYGRAARRDERKGLPYTAAMEWRKAAEPCAREARAAGYLWRQWERVTRLRRRLVGPIGVSRPEAFPQQPCCSRSAIGPAVVDQISFANAA